MENIFKKIFSGNIDEEVHNEFIKFSKGIFENRYLISAKKQINSWNVKTGYEFANFLVRKCLEKADKEIQIKGIIVSTFDLRKDKGYLFNPEEKVKQFMGIKQLSVDSIIDKKSILEIMDKYPKAFYALSFSLPDYVLKIKPKAPKNAKPSAKGESKPKINFCSLKTNDEDIIRDLFFDFTDFKEIEVGHTLKINEIILPKSIEDPVKLRELAKKKGKIIREAIVDGRIERKEMEFEA